MKHYIVIVWAWLPYKVEKTYRVERSSFGAALSEAAKKYRQEVGRKKIAELYAKAIYYAA